MEFAKIKANDKPKYMNFLLIADEEERMVKTYLYRGDMFALRDEALKALCIVTREHPGIYELKNIITVPAHQCQGYGTLLLSHIVAYYQKTGHTLYVGTGDCPAIRRFYERCGFAPSHRVKNFFLDNYDHPIVEEGQQLIDMVYLKKDLSHGCQSVAGGSS
ncbi:MAG: GNAT family N-acetyltransferase [Schwartzia sp. (in: firmicutes)]